MDQREGRAASAVRGQLLKGVPVQARRLNVNGIATSVLEAGAGPPLVLLHGGIECGGVSWAPVIPRLADRYRVVVPDVPGLGESAPVTVLDAAAFAEWFSAFLRLTCNTEPTLVAHSVLGSFAARYAAQHGHIPSGLMGLRRSKASSCVFGITGPHVNYSSREGLVVYSDRQNGPQLKAASIAEGTASGGPTCASSASS